MGWAEEECETMDLGDTRLDRRAVLLATLFQAQEPEQTDYVCHLPSEV